MNLFEEERKLMVDPIHSCAIAGALEVCWMDGLLPVIHGTGGCPCMLWLMMASNPAYLGLSEIKIPTTCLTEMDVIFGAQEKLMANVRRAVEVFNPKVIALLTSCSANIIGENMELVAETMTKELGIKVIGINTREHTWDHTEGRILTQRALVKELMHKAERKEPKSVNLIGLYPGDLNWRGDVKELKRILEGIGVKVQTALTAGSKVEELAKAPKAELNVVVSSEYGLRVAKDMEELFGIPFLDFPPPYGINGTRRWLEEIGLRLAIKKHEIERFVEEESKKVAQLVVPCLVSFGQIRLLRQIPTALLGNASRIASLIGFLREELGMKPVLVGAKNSTENSLRFLDEVKDRLNLDYSVIENIKSIEDVAKGLESKGFDFLFGSEVEKQLGKKLLYEGMAFVAIESPIFFKINVLQNPFMGFRGVAPLYQEIINARLDLYESSRPYGSFWDLPDNN